jgi:hypothetical protein
MVIGLFRVYEWAKRNNINEFKKKDIKPILASMPKGDVVSSVFAYWRWFGGLVYNPEGKKGYYGLNMDRCDQFFRGELEIPIEIWTDPLTKEKEYTKYGTIKDVPTLGRWLDEDENYIARYKSEPEQGNLIF